uniref:Putative secreted protein ovary overexpressed n=1 Tax=Rhipicephalus microplus TaxID=6941 RepID=A0A6M2DAM8_RHIMP
MRSLRPQRVVFGFLPLACLLGNASYSTAHSCGLPVFLHVVKGLRSVLLLITALRPMADEERVTNCIPLCPRETCQQSPDPPRGL